MHNLALTYLNVWDPNENLGDLQLMALVSWMSHDEARAKEMKLIVEKVEKEPLYIRAEQINSMVVITNHKIISNGAQFVLRYLASQEEATSHFEDALILLGTEIQQGCQRIWNNLPHIENSTLQLIKLSFLTFVYLFYYIFLSEKGKIKLLCPMA